MGEFELIQRYFASLTAASSGVVLGIGDDAALLEVAAGEQLVVTVDTSNADVHFPADADAFAIGYRALAVNLSDLAAMGASPRWFTLSLTLPQIDEQWLSQFSRGLAQLADEFAVALVGGDTTRGALALSIQVMGTVPRDTALRRSGAKPGDLVYVSGTPGDAAAGLACYQQRLCIDDAVTRDYLLQRYLMPTPRIALGIALRGIASSCIDVSDGLLADAGHIAQQSGVALTIFAESLPASSALSTIVENQRLPFQLSGGDDYELCFTAPRTHAQLLADIASNLNLPITCIGEVHAGSGVSCVDAQGAAVNSAVAGFVHF